VFIPPKGFRPILAFAELALRLTAPLLQKQSADALILRGKLDHGF
jgi:hypothetical protein